MRTIVLISEADTAQMNALAEQHFNPGVAETFTAAVCGQDGAISHRWVCAKFSEEKLALLYQLAAQYPGAVIRHYDENVTPHFPQLLLAEMGLRLPASQMQG